MSPEPNLPRGALLTLIALGTAAALWAMFLWYQLLRARSGFEPFCAFGSSDCGVLWDDAFAAAVHRFTGLPLAAWGVAWGVVAASLPLRALGGGVKLLGAIRWTAVAGVVGVVGLLIVSAEAGLFCSSCVGTYLLTIAYAGVALVALRPSVRRWQMAHMTPALVIFGLAWLLLLYPGLRTPSSATSQAREALGLEGTAPGQGDSAGAHSDRPGYDDPDNPLRDHPLRVPGWPLEPAQQGELLSKYLADLDPQLRQFASDYLAAYRQAEPGPEVAPRHVLGSPSAPTQLVEFTDSKCGHCAELFENLTAFGQLFPSTALAIESRQYPLDGHCNPNFPIRSPDDTRCVAAKARICLENHPDFLAFEASIYENQEDLTADMVYDLAAPYSPKGSLRACIRNAATEASLAEDIAYADAYSPKGTPVVVVNGREFTAAGPLLYALILAGGDPDHPAFAELPEPRPLPAG